MTQPRPESAAPSAADGKPSQLSTEAVETRPPGLFQLNKTFTALRIPAYRVFWYSTIFSLMGMQMQMVGRGLLAYEIGGTNSAIAVVSLGWGIPMLLFSLVGGAFADRFNRRFVILSTQLCTATIAISVAVLVQLDMINLWLLFFFGLIQGTVFSFGGPARQAYIPELVGEKQLMNAIALNSAGMNLTRIVGPSLAGALAAIAWIDIPGVFFTQAAMNLSAFLLLLVVLPLAKRGASERADGAEESATATGWGAQNGEAQGSVRGQMVDGLRYIIASPILLTLLVMGLVPSLIGMSYQTFLPVFAKEIFGDGVARNSEGLGIMMTMTGVGALAGSLVVASMQDYPRRTQLQLFAGLGFGLSLAFFAVQGNLLLALLGLTALGFTSTFFQALNSTMVMSASDPRYYGRVMSVNMMTFALMPLGTVPLGFIADHIGSLEFASLSLIGVQITQLGAGLVLAVFILFVTVKNPAYRKLEQDDFKRFAVEAADRVDDKAGSDGSAWQQLRRAARHERGSQMARKLADAEDAPQESEYSTPVQNRS